MAGMKRGLGVGKATPRNRKAWQKRCARARVCALSFFYINLFCSLLSDPKMKKNYAFPGAQVDLLFVLLIAPWFLTTCFAAVSFFFRARGVNIDFFFPTTDESMDNIEIYDVPKIRPDFRFLRFSCDE
ncbi:unnamed protein product [Sphacelaria rigidula]